MPNGCRDVIEQLKADKKNRTFAELKAILERFGFTMHPSRRGTHRTFNRPGCRVSPTLRESRGHVLAAYVRAVISALEEICDET
jgi:hypothetical protein